MRSASSSLSHTPRAMTQMGRSLMKGAKTVSNNIAVTSRQTGSDAIYRRQQFTKGWQILKGLGLRVRHYGSPGKGKKTRVFLPYLLSGVL